MEITPKIRVQMFTIGGLIFICLIGLFGAQVWATNYVAHQKKISQSQEEKSNEPVPATEQDVVDALQESFSPVFGDIRIASATEQSVIFVSTGVSSDDEMVSNIATAVESLKGTEVKISVLTIIVSADGEPYDMTTVADILGYGEAVENQLVINLD